jgi:thioredoxin reductase
MFFQAARFGSVFEQDMVVEVDIRARPFTVKTNETTIRTNRQIIR